MSIPKPNESIHPQINKLAKVALIFSLTAIGTILCGIVFTLIIPYAFYFTERVCIGLGAIASAIGSLFGIVALFQLKNEPTQKGKAMAIFSIVLGLPILLLGIWIAYALIRGPVITLPTTP